jgi:hypothetical protein
MNVSPSSTLIKIYPALFVQDLTPYVDEINRDHQGGF